MSGFGFGGTNAHLILEQAPPPDLVQLGTPTKPAASAEPRPSACVLPFRDLNVWADGKVVLCCEDWNEEYVVGDFNTQTLSEIWHGERFAEVRRKHVAKMGHEISLCGRCNAWQAPSMGARLWT